MHLVYGEKIVFDESDYNDNWELSLEKIDEKYIKGEVRIVTEQARYPLVSIPNMLNGKDYELNPEFQRRRRWDNEKKSKLIESFIMNVPIPPIFLYEDEFSHYEVMDGLQRLTTIQDFYENKFALDGLEEWRELNGFKYSQLPPQVRKGIDRRFLSSIILLQETAKSKEEAERLKQLVFERINSGGIKLSDQESRNAIYNGPMNKLCISLARNKFLCKTWMIPEPNSYEVDENAVSEELSNNQIYKTMTDVELVLRFFAYRQRFSFRKGTLKNYLDKYLRYANFNYSTQTLEMLKNIFEETIKLAYDLLGTNAFHLYRRRNGKWSWYKRPTTTVYDSLMFFLSKHLNKKEVLIENKKQIKQHFPDFYIDNYNAFEGRNTNVNDVEIRVKLYENFFNDIIR